ncbi:MAG: glycoside hydrolase family 20 zincin-like fold domain-containing protein [Terriglobia bacterium]
MGSAASLASLVTAGEKASARTVETGGTSRPVLFPHPQFIKFGERRFSIASGGRACIVAGDTANPAASRAAQIIAGEIKRRVGHSVTISATEPPPHSYPIKLSGFSGSLQGSEARIEGGYRLSTTPQGALLEGNGVGLAYAAATFNQLIGPFDGGQALGIPEIEIRDWPEFRWRAIYNEVPSVAGMSLDDWREFIRFAASLKLNAINVGLYNCWQRPSSVELDSEFFLFPSRHYPQFRTPVRSVHFSARQGRAVIRQALPAIYTEDFFGDVVAYGKEHGIEVSPCFTSLSHNTLIPRLVPEVSMKDANCNPIGYGFCTTCPKTYEILFTLYDEIITRYLEPHRVTTFNVGMDEVLKACECPSCRQAWNGVNDFYVDHLIKITRYLKQRGMKCVLMWHDMLHRTGLLNKQLVSRLESEGLLDLITIGWWYYEKPLYADSLDARNSFGKAFFCPKTPIKNWATPSSGWDTVRPLGASLRTQSAALWSLLLLAKKSGAEGAISYSIHDPVFHEGYFNFAQYSWNQAPSLGETRRRYSVWLCGNDSEAFTDSMRRYRAAYDAYSRYVVALYNREKVVRAGAALASVPHQVCRESAFQSAIHALELSGKTLASLEKKSGHSNHSRILGRYRIEARRMRTFLGAGYAALKCNAEYDGFRTQQDQASLAAFSRAMDLLNRALQDYAGCMEEQELICYPASLPRFLIYEARAYADFRQIAALFGVLLARARRGETDYLPEVTIADESFFGSDVGMVLPEDLPGSAGF